MPLLGEEARQALLLSTLAGMSTGIGGLIAIIRKPDNQLLAGLLGVAIGVMTTLSIAEMYIRNAMDHGWAGISLAVVCGILAYYLLQPYFPDFDHSHDSRSTLGAAAQPPAAKVASVKASMPNLLARNSPSGALSSSQKAADVVRPETTETGAERRERVRAAELLRLGLLMALTMTLHNMPEGFAVAFSSFTDFGPYMALAIAIHNIPEGVIVAAPVYAATGKRWKALAAAFASGLSEPVGALLAVVAVKPFISEEPLHYILAFVGGIMVAVCGIELWPEARKCKEDAKLAQGVAVGVLLMAGTLGFV